MKLFARAVVLAAAAMLAAPALAADAAVQRPIFQFVDAFNKGDAAGAQAIMATDLTIIDEVAPFLWHGSDAFARWGADYEVDAKAKGITDPGVTISAPTRELVSGDTAYVIVPSVYRFKQKGVQMSETAQMTFALHKGAAGWKISGWTWTGPDATPAK